MGKLFEYATLQETLFRAWNRIHANGRKSKAPETRIAIEQFERQAKRNIHRIQARLRAGEFKFDPQKGVLKTKKSGGQRGIVMASVHNRVVERAWLDTLQSKCSFIKDVITLPTSVGGVPERSVPHGLKLISEAFENGYSHFVRSDISGFFDHVPRAQVIDRIASEIDDQRFIETLRDATTVVLGNEKVLAEDRSVFPTDTEGVAQGSPLSPLFGNILLYEFDNKFNDGDLVCVRFIDDFLLLGKSQQQVKDAFGEAKVLLKDLGLSCHDPFSKKTSEEKAGAGEVDKGFVFLGYDIRPGLRQPSAKARQSIKNSIDDHLRYGRYAITDVINAANSYESKQRYAQTLVVVDSVLRGWGEAFAFGNSSSTLEHLDEAIDEKIRTFRKWYARKMENADWKMRRRTGGVCLLGDITPKTFDDIPVKLEKGARFVASSKTVTISTDGSVITHGRRKGRDNGPGGWAFIVHGSDQEVSGGLPSATNIQMELRAVIEAIRHTPKGRSIKIRTDSQYVHDVVEKGNTVKRNQDMWREYTKVLNGRPIKIVWVKGHSGDEHNERADKLANKAAKRQQEALVKHQ